MKSLIQFLLFFVLIISSHASTQTQNYGQGEFIDIEGVEVSTDDRWIRYGENLYEIMDPVAENFYLDSIVFVNNLSNLVKAKLSSDREFVFYNHQQYQRFRTDWSEKPLVTLPQSDSSFGARFIFGGFAFAFIGWFIYETRSKHRM